MKASERLRELDGAITPGPWQAGDSGDEMYSFSEGMGWEAYGFPLGWAGGNAGVADLRNALPLIADCIEAAERAVWCAENESQADRHAPILRREVAPALTALRDALQQPEKCPDCGHDAHTPRYCVMHDCACGEPGSPPPPEGATAP